MPCRWDFEEKGRNCCQGDSAKPLQNRGKGSTALEPRSRSTPQRPIQPEEAAARLPLPRSAGVPGIAPPDSMTAMAARSGKTSLQIDRRGALRYRSLRQRAAAWWRPLQTLLWSASPTRRPLLACQSRRCGAGKASRLSRARLQARVKMRIRRQAENSPPTKPQVFRR